jgi:membrane-associated protease RseP (regulator of RpoE activity)
MTDYEQMHRIEHLSRIATQVMDVEEVQPTTEGGAQGLQFCGELRHDPQKVYEYVQPAFQALGFTPLLRQQDNGVALIALDGQPRTHHFRRWLPLLLFVLTGASTVFVGGFMNSMGTFSLWMGLGFSLAILSILGAHEMGHFLVARRLGVAVSYPFFIPMPLSPIGTMGAVIAMKSPPQDRRALLSIAIAGPLAGLVIAVPVLLLGLHLSDVEPLSYPPSATPANSIEYLSAIWNTENPDDLPIIEGNSLLYAGLKILVFGHFLPDGQRDVFLHPIALAGWFGLLITALNLTPAGQLDGGHILYALAGPRVARIVTRLVAIILFVLGFLWVGWFLWALLVTLFGQHRAPLLNDVTPLDRRQKMVAVLGLVVFVLVFTPIPLTVVVLPMH